MKRVFAIKLAVLHLFQTPGSIALFFSRSIVTTLALRAFHNYQFTHFNNLAFNLPQNCRLPHYGRGGSFMKQPGTTDAAPGVESSNQIIR